MAVNLVDNVRDALDKLHVRSTHCWLSPELWPAYVLNEPSEESQTEAKLVQKVMGVAVNEKKRG